MEINVEIKIKWQHRWQEEKRATKYSPHCKHLKSENGFPFTLHSCWHFDLIETYPINNSLQYLTTLKVQITHCSDIYRESIPAN